MALDLSKPLQQAKIPAGTILYNPGAQPAALTLVHQGEVQCVNRFDKSGKRKLYSLGANSVAGFTQLLLGQPLPCGLRVTQDSVISSFPVRGAFQNLILGKLNVGMMAVRSLMTETMQAQQAVRGLATYLTQILRANDNLSLAYFRCNPEVFKTQGHEGPGDVIDPALTAARMVVADFQQNGGQLPQTFNQIWLQGDHSGILKKSYEFESSFDTEEFNFLRRLLALPANLQGEMFKSDIKILEGLCRKLAQEIQGCIQEIYQLQDGIDTSLETLMHGDYSFVEKFYLLSDLLNSGFNNVSLPEFTAMARFLQSTADALLRNYQTLQEVPYPANAPGLAKLRDFVAENKEAAREAEPRPAVTAVQAGVNMDAIKAELAGSAGKIMGFLKTPADEQKAILGHLKTFRGLQNPMDSGGDPRKLRRAISQIYWKIYEQAYEKFKESRGNVPRPVQMLLHYGFFDEDLLDLDAQAFLYSVEDSSAARFPIYNALDWLDRVATAAEPPSVDEMGLTYFEKLKNEFKDKGWKRETDMPPDINTRERRLRYEIMNFLEINVRLTSGSPATAFPILTRYQITTPLDKAFVSFERLSDEIDNLLKTDYSAFHREVIMNDEERGILKEFVMKQVIPNFIIVPSIGTKVMMWQDVSGRSKSSSGRIAVPVFATADLLTLLLEAIAAFRWELTKTIMGPDWNNVSQSSITADYTDYVQFYKKNRELSQEIKEKLAAEFKRFRSDRDRFTNDYISWIKYESQGVMKLNKVARGVFYRHIPFAKPIRDGLANQPAFADIHNRFKNIRMRKYKELEIKYRKYGEQIPPELQESLDFYKV